MYIKDLLQTGGNSLEKEVLLAYILQKPREFLLSNSDYDVSNENCSSFFEMIRRHERGIPVAYLTNHKEFYGLPFYVDRRVLIPRPETEFLVEKVLELVQNDIKLNRIIDIGTGSGNIAVTLATHLKDIVISATDVSENALEVAKMNAKRMNVEDRVRFIESNLMDDINEDFDIIVANLPYIGEETNNFVSKETDEHEPHVALYGGQDGLELYEELFKKIKNFKYLLGEIGFMHREKLEELFKKYFPTFKCEIINDLAGLDRYFIITT
ncbi:peptide chain release factor N(5)-glutamine methyltransferase [Patescibacteria group bacterium]